MGRRPELHGVSGARNSGGASATGLLGAARRQPRTWAEPARPAGAGGVEASAVQGVRGARSPRREARTRTGEKGAAWIIVGSAKPSRETQGKGKTRARLREPLGWAKRASQPEGETPWEPATERKGCPRGDACERRAERSLSCLPLPAGLGGGAWAAGQRSSGSKRGKRCRSTM